MRKGKCGEEVPESPGLELCLAGVEGRNGLRVCTDITSSY